jgi:hypothetical protein
MCASSRVELVKVSVYRYFVFVEELGRQVTRRPPRMGTLEAIRAAGGVPLLTTETLVEASLLDEQGFTAVTESAD